MKTKILLAAALLLCLGVQAKEYELESWRFSIEIPDNWQVEVHENQNPVLSATDADGSVLRVEAVRAPKKQRLRLRGVRQNFDAGVPAGAQLVEKTSPPWYDLLCNSFARTYLHADGRKVQRALYMRSDAVFVIDALSASGDGGQIRAVLGSVDVHPSFRDNLNRAADALGTVGLTLLLSLFPVLGGMTGKYRHIYKREKEKGGSLLLWGSLSLVWFGVAFFALKSQPWFALIVVGVMAAIWILLAGRNKFMYDFYKGFFGA